MEFGNFIPFHDVPACPSLTLIKRSRQPKALLGAPQIVEGAVRIPGNRFHPGVGSPCPGRTPIALAWRGMLLPCLPSVVAHGDQVGTRCEFISRCGRRNDANSDLPCGPMARWLDPPCALIRDRSSHLAPRSLADLITDTVSVIPDHMSGSVGATRIQGRSSKRVSERFSTTTSRPRSCWHRPRYECLRPS